MKRNCPYCGGPCDFTEPALSERKTRIYHAVVSAGKRGIKTMSLVGQMYRFGEKPSRRATGVLRVQIYEINKKLVPFKQRIQAKPRGIYRLVSTEEESQWLDR